MLRFLTFAFAIVTLAPAALAQINPTLSEAERGIRRDDAPAAHLKIDALDIGVHLVGRTADVTVEMLIGSDDADSDEATLSLTLPADAVVTGYALDVDGKMIPGQLLEAPKARNVYEDEVRAGIDPGLAEIVGNRFTTRIFPIDASHPRRFRLHFAASFDPSIGLVLPIAREAAIGRVNISVSADGYATVPAIRFAGRTLDLARHGAGWRADAELGKAVLREGMTITGGTIAGTMIVARHANGQPFFVIGDTGTAAAPSPSSNGRLRIYWDRSLSHRADRIDLEADLLARLVDRTAPTGIDLVTFASDRPQHVTVTDAGALKAALGRVVYRGGTSLAGLDALPLRPARQCVIVFDGTVTIDQGATFAPDCRLMALTTSTGADGARLGRLTQQTGGTVVRMVAGGEPGALAALTARQATPISVRDDAGTRIETRALPAGPGNWLLVGPKPTGGVTVRLSDGRERRYHAEGEPIAADAPAALWAADRVASLADDPARHANMADTARSFQVAGPGMSFLVLERPDQYLRADLTPPAGFDKAWLASYAEQKREWDDEHSGARQERLTFVLAEWRERRAWWNRKFVPLTRLQTKAPGNAHGSLEMAPPPEVAPPPPPPPPVSSPPAAPLQAVTMPAPSPPSAASVQPITTIAASSADGGGADEIVVAGSRRRDVPVAAQPRPAAIELDMAELITARPYITALNAAGPKARQTVLADQERRYGTVPTFYLDTAEWFRSKGDAPTAALLLLSALELPTSDDETRQIVAFRLERDRSFDRAVEIAERLAAANADFRPQPSRDLALALAARGRAAGKAGRADLERALKLLVDAALNPASRDFDGFEVIALMEANALIPAIEAVGGKWALDRRLVGLTDTDARIVIEWTADDADIDLWVDEPNGERVMYSNKLSSAGGQISNDMTNGYGPEEYAIRRAPAGAYRVRINGYDADRINPNGPGHVLVRLQRNFARPTEAQELVDLDLSFQRGRNRDRDEETRPVATLRVGR